MVTDISDVEVTKAPADGAEAEVVETDAVEPSEGAEAEVAEETPEPDKLAELQSAFDTFRESAATKDELQPLRSGVGRLDDIQSKLAELAKQNPLASVDPRITGLETAFAAVLDGLIADPATDDARRASLTQTRQQLDAAGRQREIDSAVTEAVGKAIPQTEETPEAPPAADAQAAVEAVSGELQRYASRKSVDYQSIPAEVLAFKPTETMAEARDRVMDHIDGLAEEAGATDRVTARAAAAGGGTPSRSGGASTIDDLLKKLEEHGPTKLTEAENERVRDHLGVKV